MTSGFLLKHESLITALITAYPQYSVQSNEVALSQGAFPAIGIFLGISEHSRDSRTYKAVQYSYVLGVFDILDMDDGNDAISKQRSTFEQLEAIILSMGYEISSEIEPLVSIASGEGSFITGWTTNITFNS